MVHFLKAQNATLHSTMTTGSKGAILRQMSKIGFVAGHGPRKNK
jgi:hypothetical protein